MIHKNDVLPEWLTLSLAFKMSTEKITPLFSKLQIKFIYVCFLLTKNDRPNNIYQPICIVSLNCKNSIRWEWIIKYIKQMLYIYFFLISKLCKSSVDCHNLRLPWKSVLVLYSFQQGHFKVKTSAIFFTFCSLRGITTPWRDPWPMSQSQSLWSSESLFNKS